MYYIMLKFVGAACSGRITYYEVTVREGINVQGVAIVYL